MYKLYGTTHTSTCAAKAALTEAGPLEEVEIKTRAKQYLNGQPQLFTIGTPAICLSQKRKFSKLAKQAVWLPMVAPREGRYRFGQDYA